MRKTSSRSECRLRPTRRSPRARRGPSRPEARQHHADAEGAVEAARLRPRAANRAGGADGDGDNVGNRQQRIGDLPVHGAGSCAARRSAHGRTYGRSALSFTSSGPGRRPFGGDDIASIVEGVLSRTPEPVSNFRATLAPGLSFIVQKALSKAPTGRYQSAAEVGAALQALQSGSSLGSDFAGVRRIRKPSPTIGRWVAIAAVVAVAAAGGLWWSRQGVAPP